MSITIEKLLEVPGAELVGGNVVAGIMADRKTLGRTNEDGVLTVTKEGQEAVEALEKPKKAAKEVKAPEGTTPDAKAPDAAAK